MDIPVREYSGERRRAFSIVGRIVFVKSSDVTNVEMKSSKAVYDGTNEKVDSSKDRHTYEGMFWYRTFGH